LSIPASAIPEDYIMITATIKKTVTDAITSTVKAENKWLATGEVVRAEYADKAALEAVRAEFLSEVIYPAMGEEAVRVIEAVIPAKNHKDYIGATAELRAQWDSMSEAKKTVRGKGSVYFGRVIKYAYPETDKAEAEDATEQAKLLKLASALLVRIQKDASPTYRHADACRVAQALVSFLT
jgi:hypothetical protein